MGSLLQRSRNRDGKLVDVVVLVVFVKMRHGNQGADSSIAGKHS